MSLFVRYPTEELNIVGCNFIYSQLFISICIKVYSRFVILINAFYYVGNPCYYEKTDVFDVLNLFSCHVPFLVSVIYSSVIDINLK